MKISKYVNATRKEKSEIHYFDDDMNPVSRDRATRVLVRNRDEKGNLLFEVEGFIDS
jgi:hypothetical protein